MQVLYRQRHHCEGYDGHKYPNEVRVVLRKWQAPGYANPDVVIETVVSVDGDSTLLTSIMPPDWTDWTAQRYAINKFDTLLLNHPTLGESNDPE
jgi:hypothetical protein